MSPGGPAGTLGDPGDWGPVLDDLAARRAAASAMGGEARLAERRATGRLNARERIAALCDEGSFVELGALVGDLPADAFVAGVGDVDGRAVAVGAEDFTVAGGSIGAGTAAKRHRLVELARQERMPLVFLLEGAGHRPPLPTDPPSLRRPNDLQALADASGCIPLAAAVLGSSAGHGALTVPLSDFTVMTPDAAIFTAGPPLVKASLGEEVDRLALGGPDVALASGVVHNLAADELDALAQLRRWLSYLPSSAWERPPVVDSTDGDRPTPELYGLVPRNPRTAYDMIRVIEVVVDRGSWFEVQPRFGRSLVTGLARLGGQPVAVVANQPLHLAGTIDADAADKASHFLQVADAFHLPVVLLTDNPGVMAGTVAERSGILRHAGRMFAVQHRLRVPKLQVTLRKAYGFGSSAMGMNPFDGQTLNLAFPGVTFGAMPSRGADDATKADDDRRAALLAAELASGYRSAAGMSVDDLVDPAELRSRLLTGLRMAAARLRGPAEPVAHLGILR
jgi:acetyl-CoA carboxylase carboxyltransferase component